MLALAVRTLADVMSDEASWTLSCSCPPTIDACKVPGLSNLAKIRKITTGKWSLMSVRNDKCLAAFRPIGRTLQLLRGSGNGFKLIQSPGVKTGSVVVVDAARPPRKASKSRKEFSKMTKPLPINGYCHGVQCLRQVSL